MDVMEESGPRAEAALTPTLSQGERETKGGSRAQRLAGFGVSPNNLTTSSPTPRKARIGDVPSMHRLINEHAEAGWMLARPLSELYENLRDFWVLEEGAEVVACCALHINWVDLAEIRSLAVGERFQRRGLGRTLVGACLEEARQMGIGRAYALTREPLFFESIGFKRIGVSELPRKVWGECIRCPKFPECDEVAEVFDLQ